MTNYEVRYGLEKLARRFTSPNVLDANGEEANVVDTLDDIANAIAANGDASRQVAQALNRIADALHNRNDQA